MSDEKPLRDMTPSEYAAAKREMLARTVPTAPTPPAEVEISKMKPKAYAEHKHRVLGLPIPNWRK